MLPLGKTQQVSNVCSHHSHKTLFWRSSQENERPEERGGIFLGMSTCIQLQPREDFIEKCNLSLNSPRLAHDSSAPPQGKVTWRLQV